MADRSVLLARCAFPPPGTPLDCAVSGGADSLALLVLAVAAGCEATAWHVDHGLRPGSADEADVVRAAASALGARFESVAVDVGAGPNLEARARAARYAALPPGVATGHTADDRAETVLVNLVRGAGIAGLAALAGPSPRRPILALRRCETRDLCAAEGLAPVEDPSNADPSFVRNRIRHEVLPLLDAVAGRDVAGVLARQAALLADDAAFLDALAEAVDPADAAALAAAPLPLARRAVRRWWADAGAGLDGLGEAHPPDAAAVERVLSVARGERVACDVGNGWEVRRSAGVLRLGLK